MKIYFGVFLSLLAICISGIICSLVFYILNNAIIGSIAAIIACISLWLILIINKIYLSKQIKKEFDEQTKFLLNIQGEIDETHNKH